MCLDPDDFDKYLSSTIAEATDIGVTSNELIRAVVLYTEDAMKYYFPSSANTGDGGGSISGITLSEWIDASFRCDLLELPFSVNDGIGVRRNQFLHLRRRRRRQRQRHM
jgi:hypothetical protein